MDTIWTLTHRPDGMPTSFPKKYKYVCKMKAREYLHFKEVMVGNKLASNKPIEKLLNCRIYHKIFATHVLFAFARRRDLVYFNLKYL